MIYWQNLFLHKSSEIRDMFNKALENTVELVQ
jgi:hypothetical protein